MALHDFLSIFGRTYDNFCHKIKILSHTKIQRHQERLKSIFLVYVTLYLRVRRGCFLAFLDSINHLTYPIDMGYQIAIINLIKN